MGELERGNRGRTGERTERNAGGVKSSLPLPYRRPIQIHLAAAMHRREIPQRLRDYEVYNSTKSRSIHLHFRGRFRVWRMRLYHIKDVRAAGAKIGHVTSGGERGARTTDAIAADDLYLAPWEIEKNKMSSHSSGM